MNELQFTHGDKQPTRPYEANSCCLVPGSEFANKYRILEKHGEDLFFAESKDDGGRKFLLRFVSSRKLLESLTVLHEKVKSPYVCQLLDVIDTMGEYTACLVFERGDKTLKELLRQGFRDLFQKKHVLLQVFECLKFYHECDLVHCDICPWTVVFSYLDHAWKLQDNGTTVGKGQQPLPCRKSKYVAPEIRLGTKAVGSPADMWSAGLLVLGVLADMDLDDFFVCQNLDATHEPSEFDTHIERIQGIHSKNLIRSLVQPDPTQRLSADRALEHEAFKTAEESPLTVEMPFLGVSQIDARMEGIDIAMPLILQALEPRFRAFEENVKQPIRDLKRELSETIRTKFIQPVVDEIQEVGNSVSNIRKTVDATYEEICKANLMVNINLEKIDRSKRVVDPTVRGGRMALTLADDYLPDEPVFLMRRKEHHRLRISLTHKHESEAVNFKICSVFAKPSDDNKLLELDCTETKPPSEGNEVVAWFKTDFFPQSRLNRRCRQFGSVDEKYVQVAVKIIVAMASNESTTRNENFIEMNGTIWCKPVSKFSINLTMRRFARFSSENWKRAPQWMRDAGRGAVILAEIGFNAV